MILGSLHGAVVDNWSSLLGGRSLNSLVTDGIRGRDCRRGWVIGLGSRRLRTAAALDARRGLVIVGCSVSHSQLGGRSGCN